MVKRKKLSTAQTRGRSKRAIAIDRALPARNLGKKAYRGNRNRGDLGRSSV